jgi:hypothetical protein
MNQYDAGVLAALRSVMASEIRLPAQYLKRLRQIGYDIYPIALKPEIECPCCKDWFTPCNDVTHGNELHMCAFCTLGQHNLEAACYPEVDY